MIEKDDTMTDGRAFMKICVLVLGLMLTLPALVSIMAMGEDELLDSVNSGVEMEYTNVDVRIHNSYAITEVTQGFVNNGEIAAEHTFAYSIPEEAFVSNLTITVGDDVMYSIAVPKDVATAAYDYQVSMGVTASHLTYRGNSVYKHSFNLEAGESAEVVFRYEEFIPRKFGFYNYSQIIDPATYQGTFEFEARIQYTEAISNVTVSGFPEPVIDMQRVNRVLVLADCSPDLLENMIRITYEVDNPPDEGRMIFFEDENTGYFMHIFSPEVEDVGGDTMPKQITFCIDRSGSMSGNKIEQVKDAFSAILPSLDPRDSFGIVLFDSSIQEPLGSSLITADTDEKENAVSTVNAIYPGGSTNIGQAMDDGLGQLGRAESENPILVLLTDGQPTSGTCNPVLLRQEIENANAIGAQIYCLGFGNDVDFGLLEAISLENNGEAIRIYLGTDAADQITDFYDMISVTMLGNITFEYSPGASMWYPEETQSLFQGSEIVVSGIYPRGNDEVITDISGMSDSGPVTYSRTFHTDPDPDDEYVSRFWAYARINHLLDRISVEGESNETVGEIRAIAISYNFVTPYTSFVTGDLLEEALAAAGYDLSTYMGFSTNYVPSTTAVYDWSAVSQSVDPGLSLPVPDNNVTYGGTSSSAPSDSTGLFMKPGITDVDQDSISYSANEDGNSLPAPSIPFIFAVVGLVAMMFIRQKRVRAEENRTKRRK